MADTADGFERLAERVLFMLQEGQSAVRLHGRQLTPIRTGDHRLLTHQGGTRVDAVLCGSFAPLHAGHRRMHQVARQKLGASVDFELSIDNTDKPRCSPAELGRRLSQFAADETIWITRLPTFHEKAQRLRPRWFIVGTDTLRRIADLRFYQGDSTRLAAAIRCWEIHEIRFLVFGRKEGELFHELEQLPLPPPLRERCVGIGQADFRHDISSTELREAGEW